MNIISRLLFRYFGDEALVEYVQLKETPPEIEYNMLIDRFHVKSPLSKIQK